MSRVALARRWLRLFRFLESFSAAQAIVSGRAGGGRRSGGLPAELLLDALSRTLNGLYLLLETLTLPSVLGIHGLPSFLPGDEPWAGKYGTSRMLAKEAQRFWFLSLVCAFAAAGVRAFKTLVYAAVPETGEGYGTGEKAALAPQQKEDHHHQHDQHHGASLTKHEANDVSTEPAVGDLSALQQERARLRLIVEARKAERISRRRAVGAAVALQTRTMAITSLDMLTPGTAIGWLWAPRPIVALAMLTSTWQTAKDVWRRCEKEIVLGR